MKTIVIGAGTDLGVHIDGAHLGPLQLMNDMKSFYKSEMINLIQEDSIVKSRNLSDKRKNNLELEKFNTAIYKITSQKINEKFFPIVLGGDHSVTIPSVLADAKANDSKLGLICIDAHTNYNTFETTVTGNIFGLSTAAVTGWKCEELRTYFDGHCIDSRKTVIIGARNIETWQRDNLKYSGVTIYTTEDIREKGIETVIKEAFRIAMDRNKAVHVCYGIDVIDPDIAPGVSTPEVDGITEEEATEILEKLLERVNDISGIDIVEFNPLRDENRKTEQIALNLVARSIQVVEKNKGKFVPQKKY